MLGTFPKAFSQTATSQGYSPKCAISQEQLAKSVLAAALGPPPLQPVAPQRARPNLLEVAAWEIAHLGSCPLGN